MIVTVNEEREPSVKLCTPAPFSQHVVHLTMFPRKQALLGYLHSHRQPWLKKDIERVLGESEIAPVRAGAYIGIHVRRGDKLLHEARRHETEVGAIQPYE